MNYIRIIFYCMIFSFSFGETLLVPENYSRIQRAIDSAVEGDTVLVNQGTYCENLILNKSVTLASYAIFENLDNWLSEDGSQVESATILNTIIDGSEQCISNNNQAPPPPSGQWLDDVDHGSVILVVKDPDVDDCVTPTIYGLTIKGGYGTRVSRDIAPPGETPVYQIQRLGGGILSKDANPIVNYNQIIDNDLIGTNSSRDGEPGYGGGINSSLDEDFGFINYNSVEIEVIEVPSRCDIEEFNFANNFFYNNDANYGRTLSNKLFSNSFDLSGSSFDVASCDTDEVSNVWIEINDATPNYSNIQSTLCAIQEPEVYIDSNINSECLTQDCGTEQNPFKTIKRAIAMIFPDEEHPITLNLANGNYNPANGEIFPIVVQNFVSFTGENKYSTVIDAQETERVMRIENTLENKIENLTIAGGKAIFINAMLESFETGGGGIYIARSGPIIFDVFFTSNVAINTQGAALSINFGGDETPKIINSDFTANIGESTVYVNTATGSFYNCNIYENSMNGVQGSSANATFRNSKIYNNAGCGIKSIFGTLINSIVTNHSQGNIDPGWQHIYLINSIVYTGGFQENHLNPSNASFEYSNVNVADDIHEYGEGNINVNPQFINNDFVLGDNSPCIDQGNPDVWYNDINQTRNDMGAYGGPFFQPDFYGISDYSYNFGFVGLAGSATNFKLFNFRETPIIIDDFSHTDPLNNFYVDVQLPLEIPPYSESIIPIICNPQGYGVISDQACIESDDISSGSCLSLNATVLEGNLLAGNLSGILPAGEYEVSSGIFVQENDELIIQPGTHVSFYQGADFIIYGTLIAEGTENDSIFFTGYNNNLWGHMLIAEQENNSILKYCKITHGTGWVLAIQNASPTIENCTLTKNNGTSILNGWGSNLKMLNTSIVKNISNWVTMYFDNSSPLIINSTIANNLSPEGTIYINSNPTFINSIFYDNCNTPNCLETVGQEHLGPFNPTAYNCNFEDGFTLQYSDNDGIYDWNDVGENNISVPPQFIDPEIGNFRLQASSECIDEGVAYLEINNQVFVDFDTSEYYGESPDIGAYEWYPPECGDGNCSEDENYYICPDDCSAPNECEEGYVIDCSGDGDCCEESWIGDGFGDCENQQWGCDLTCYDNDGGDCDDFSFSDEDENQNILDIIILITIIINNGAYDISGDINQDSVIDILDIIELTNIILRN